MNTLEVDDECCCGGTFTLRLPAAYTTTFKERHDKWLNEHAVCRKRKAEAKQAPPILGPARAQPR